MSVRITRDFPRLTELRLTTREMMREIGDLAKETIIRRTRAGQGTKGALLPYSAGYAKVKAAELGSASPVDLTVSGDMLDSLEIVEVDDRSVTLGWTR